MPPTPIALRIHRIFSAPTRGALFFCILATLASGGCSSSTDTAPAGTGAVCGDGTVTAPEECDEGSVLTETCSYGEASCTVCSAACLLVPGRTSLCGDGVVDGENGETCDDGAELTEPCAYGETACEVCDATCQRAPGLPSFCGDGVVDDAAGEGCDDGNAELDACAYGEAECSVCGADCQSAPGVPVFCGDGVVDAANGEACDDGNAVDGDGCDSTCTPTGCGNGVVAGAESCDDGNLVNDDGCDASCQPTGCGSGIVTGSELCDDGNLVDGDGCDSNCTPTGCGNGVVAGGEACDDGNTVLETCSYGVNAGCTVCDATCQSVPGVISYCGDGLIDPKNTEDCEDGNVLEGDGCEANCKFLCGAGSGATRAYLTTTGCYLYFGYGASWDAAQSTCAAIGAGFSLVSVGSAAENFAVAGYVQGTKTWLGFNDIAVEGSFVWANGDPVSYVHWSPGEPNDYANSEDCADFETSTYWNDSTCSSTLPFVCEQETCGDGMLSANELCDDGNLVDGDGCDSTCKPTGCGSGIVTAGEACDDGNQLNGDGCEANCALVCGTGSGADAAYQFGGHCYLRYGATVSWTAAEQTCVAHGGHLVSIQDAAEQVFVQGLIQGNTHIGLTDSAVEGTFVWASGAPVSYTNWGFGEPNNSGGNEDCALMFKASGMWNDGPCSGLLSSVCEL
jgi:cysteine-rich repeat protein